MSPLLLLSLAGALAQDTSPWLFHLEGGLAAGYGPPDSVAGFGAGHLVINVGRWAVEGGGREGIAGRDLRQVGNIVLGARYRVREHAWLRLCFAHNHEVPWDRFTQDIAGSFLGNADGIRHRSGIELGAGLAMPYDLLGQERAAPWVGVAGQLYVLDEQKPVGYLVIEGGLRIGAVPR